MLLKSYTKEIFRPGAIRAFSLSTVLLIWIRTSPRPYPLSNSALGGFEYFREPPAVTFRIHGKIITVHPRAIAVNALKDEEEAEKRFAVAAAGN